MWRTCEDSHFHVGIPFVGMSCLTTSKHLTCDVDVSVQHIDLSLCTTAATLTRCQDGNTQLGCVSGHGPGLRSVHMT